MYITHYMNTHSGKLTSHLLYMGTHGIIDGDKISSVYVVKMVKRRVLYLPYIKNSLRGSFMCTREGMKVINVALYIFKSTENEIT